MTDFIAITILGTTAGITVDFTIEAVQDIHDGEGSKISSRIAVLSATVFGVVLATMILKGGGA